MAVAVYPHIKNGILEESIVMTAVEAKHLKSVLEKANNKNTNWTYDETILVSQVIGSLTQKGI